MNLILVLIVLAAFLFVGVARSQAQTRPPVMVVLQDVQGVVKTGKAAIVRHSGPPGATFTDGGGSVYKVLIADVGLAVIETPSGAASVAVAGGPAFDLKNARSVAPAATLAGILITGNSVTNTGSNAVVAIHDGGAQIIAPGATVQVPAYSQIVDPISATGLVVSAAAPGIRFNTGDGTWNLGGVTPRVSALGTANLDVDAPKISWRTLEDIQPNGTTDTCTHDVTTLGKAFFSGGAGASFDIGILRFSLDGFYGSWRADGKLHSLCTEPGGFGSGPVTTMDSLRNVSSAGSLYGMNVAVYWPAFVYKTGNLEVSIGPTAGFLWLVEVVEKVDGQSRSSESHEFAGAAGGQISVRYFLSKGVALTVEGGVRYVFGDVRGASEFGSVGLTFQP